MTELSGLSELSKQKTTLIDATLERIEANLILSRADEKTIELYRVTMGDGCYFAARGDLDREAFEHIGQLQPGTAMRVCVFEQRGRRHIAWIRSQERSLPPYDLLAQRRRNLTLLPISLGLLVGSVAALSIPASLIEVLALLGAIFSFLGCAIAIGGLCSSLNPVRTEAQERWQREPYRFVAEGSDR